MAFADDGTSATHVSGAAPFILVTAGGAWFKGDLLGRSGTSIVQADATATAIQPEFVAATDAVSGETNKKVYFQALVRGGRYSGGTAGSTLYLSNTAGGCGESAGDTSIVVGMTMAADAVFLNPRLALQTAGVTSTGAIILNDDVSLNLGSDSDDAIRHKSTATLADTAVAGVLTGTASRQALAADSLIISNTTQDGDLGIYVAGLGATTSLEAIWIDASAGLIEFGHGGFDVLVANGQGVVVGSTTQRTLNALVPEFQVQGTTVGVDAAIAAVLYSSTAAEGAEIILARSKSATLGTNTIVASGDLLGRIVALGADGGTGFDPAAAIAFEVDGSPGASTDMPGRIVFLTSPDGSQTPTEVFRVTSAQNLVVGNANGLIVGSTTINTISDGDGATNLIPEFQLHGVGTAFAGGAALVASYNTTNDRTVSPKIALLKGAAATQVATTAVADNEVVGSIIAYASDGADFETPVAAIEFVVDDAGGPGAGAIGGSLEFYTTADGGETLTKRLTITTGGVLHTPDGALVIHGAAAGHSTAGTNAITMKVGTPPSGAATTSSSVYASATILRKVIADGTDSAVG